MPVSSKYQMKINYKTGMVVKGNFPEPILIRYVSKFTFRQALKVLQSLEGTGGLQWNNLWGRIEPDDPMTMGLYWLMFLVDMAIYAFIMWYIDTIKPGTYGVGRKWYFPFEVQ